MREFIRRHRGLIAGAVLAVAVVAFVAFRPDKLFVDDAVDESLADAFATVRVSTTGASTPATVPVATTTTTIEPAASTVPELATTTTMMAEPSAPAVVSSGSFYGIGHAASGTATVYEQDGRYVLRFEDDIDIQNGPDLYVWVLLAGDYDRSAIEGHIDLGKLKGNVGGQNYELPAEFDPMLHRSVLIWCERFRVPFAAVPFDDI